MAVDTLRDGFVRLCFDPSANILSSTCRMVLEGQKLATGTAPVDALTKVTSARDIDTQFGAGSILAEALKIAIKCCSSGGVEIFAIPRAGVGVAASYTMTVTGPATSDGYIDIFAGDSSYNTSTKITSGMTATQIATAIAANYGTNFPYTVTTAAGVITFTSKNAGIVGNVFNPIVNWHGRNNYMPAGVTLTTAQLVVGTGTPVALNYSTVLGECCVCCYALLSPDTTWQTGVTKYFDDAWACDKPQCFGHAYLYNSGTLGQILATDTNSASASRLAHGAADVAFPWLKVAAYAATSCCLTQDNPELSIQGPNFGVLSCLAQPETCTQPFTFAEQEQLREAGFVVTVPATGGKGGLTRLYVTNDVTNNRYDAEGRRNLTFQDVASRRLASTTAVAISKKLQEFNGLGYYTAGTAIRSGTRGTNKRIMLGAMRAWAKTQIGVLFSEFPNLDQDLTMTDDFETAPRCQGIPGKLRMNLVYRPPVRIKQVIVNAKPVLLTNC